ncbi:MAG: hypothetical protein LUQ38_05475 [Methanotrichaceae archaeon]|nr:hypothetical protein [Methanotrichaceae archaeon]MDD1758221.1 hypothetical protein [Methanotrichaceae archaeon]
MDTPFNLKGGVVIIGSLLWQDDLNGNDKIRKKWRKIRLQSDKKLLVKLPIRYGRLSNNNIFTMVFSMNCERYNQYGTGYIIPFKSNPFNTYRQMLYEATALARVEGIPEGLESNWGKVSIIFNPKLSQEVKRKVLNFWKSKFQKRDQRDYRLGKEKPCLNKNFELSISWPKYIFSKSLSVLSELDFLLATANKPNKKHYPTPLDIAAKVRQDKIRFYFAGNIQSGIRTFQDGEIIKYL